MFHHGHLWYKVPMNSTNQDEYWMRHALELAAQGLGLTSPNPSVGAVIVHEGRIIGSGFHQKAGLPHAERNAIADGIARGNESLFPDSTIYVTLEPCSTTGSTPPCTDAIIQHHFQRVAYGSEDPNPRHKGVAERILTKSNIIVSKGILKNECDHLIRAFTMNMLNKRPWVIAKSAMSLDGRISRSPGRSQWLTNECSRSFVHTLRSECDAIMTGGNTVRLDNPALTIRCPDRPVSLLKEQPWRIILTKNSSSIPKDAVCLTDEFRERTIIVENVFSYLELLQNLYSSHKIGTLLLESGGVLMRDFLQAGLVDEWVGFYAPMLTGGGMLAVAGDQFLGREAFLSNPSVRMFGDDVCIRGEVQYLQD